MREPGAIESVSLLHYTSSIQAVMVSPWMNVKDKVSEEGLDLLVNSGGQT